MRVDTTFFQLDGACLHTASMALDALCHVFRSHGLSNQFLECFRYEWSWLPCSLDMKPCNYSIWSYFKDCMCCTSLHTVQELHVEIEAVAEDITHTLHDTVDIFVVPSQ